MKPGRSLIDLATEVERQVQTRKDYIAPTQQLALVAKPEGVQLAGLNGEEYAVRPFAHAQLADQLGIPKGYYDRMLKDAPDLLASNVNRWFAQEPKRRMVRTLDHSVRAVLSDRYRPLDNFDLMNAALPVIKDRRGEIVSSELTDTRMYLKVVDPSLSAPAPNPRKVGDIVQAGAVVRNSEVGDGALAIEALLFQLSCLNGSIIGVSLKRFHIGKRAELDAAVREVLSSAAREADDKAFWLAFRDVFKAAFDPAIFRENVDKVNAAAGRKIGERSIEKTVESVVTLTLGPAPEAIRQSVLRQFIEAGDLSQFGLSAAVTAAAQAPELDYETATDMERAGGRIIELDASAWKEVAA